MDGEFALSLMGDDSALFKNKAAVATTGPQAEYQWCRKKNVVGGSPSPPHGARFCLHIHLPGGLNHCTADGLTRCREATSHALPTVHRGCNTIHLRLMSHTARADVICATNYASISRLGLCGQALHWEKQIRLVICKMILKGPAAKT